MPDQVSVVPADGAVAAAVDPRVVAPSAPADAASDKNAQNANDNVVLRLRRLVFSLVLVFVFLRAFFGLGVVGLLAWFSLLCY